MWSWRYWETMVTECHHIDSSYMIFELLNGQISTFEELFVWLFVNSREKVEFFVVSNWSPKLNFPSTAGILMEHRLFMSIRALSLFPNYLNISLSSVLFMTLLIESLLKLLSRMVILLLCHGLMIPPSLVGTRSQFSNANKWTNGPCSWMSSRITASFWSSLFHFKGSIFLIYHAP